MGAGGNGGEEEDTSFFAMLWTRVVSIATLGRRHVQARGGDSSLCNIPRGTYWVVPEATYCVVPARGVCWKQVLVYAILKE